MVSPGLARTVGSTLATIDVGAKKVTKSVKVTGINGKLHGVDVRPADGMLYGLVADGSVVTIDTASGKATVRSKLDNMLPAGVAGTIDFNPVADRMRVIEALGRLTPRAIIDRITKHADVETKSHREEVAQFPLEGKYPRTNLHL